MTDKRRVPGGRLARAARHRAAVSRHHADAKRGKEAVSDKARKPCPSHAWKAVRDALCVARQREACADRRKKLACRVAG